jgi:hypothetical protein
MYVNSTQHCNDTPAPMLNLTSFVLANPFVYTFVLASVYAVITKFGYAQVAELIYSAIQFTVLRSANRNYIKCWRDLRAAKLDVSKVSAQVRNFDFGVAPLFQMF